MPVRSAQPNIPPSGMAGPAELNRIGGIKTPRVENKSLIGFAPRHAHHEDLRFHGSHVVSAWPVARFARNSQLKSGGIDGIFRTYSSGVTPKAAHHVSVAHGPRRCFFQIARRTEGAARRELKIVQRAEETRASLIPVAVPQIKIRLAHGPCAKCPA